MHDLKFLEASQVKPFPPSSDFPSGIIRDVYEGFRQNVTIATGVSILPGLAFWTGTKVDEAAKKALVDVVGSHRQPNTEEEKNKVAWKTALYVDQALSPKGDRDRWYQKLDAHTLQFEALIAHKHEKLHMLAHSVLKNMVIQAYTAFEVLAADLLETVRKAHPCLLPIKPYHFQSTLAIKTAYAHAFNDVAVSSAVITPPVRALALVRNAIVHAGGYADDWFMDREKDGYPCNDFLKAKWPTIKEGDEIRLDGEFVRELIELATFQGCDLVREVDKWIRARIP